MIKVRRYDTGTIELIPQRDGFLRARVVIARDGVFPYLHPDGKLVMEAKLPEEIFSEATIQTAKGVPVLDGHPPFNDSMGLVTPENYSKYVKGALGDSVEVADNLLNATETVFDSRLIESLENGEKLEVSIGFETEIDPTPGEYQGERYDVAQRNIRINHIAHVESGRAGNEVRAYLDEAIPEGIAIAVMQNNTIQRRETMPDPKKKTVHDDGTILDGMKRFFALFSTKTKHDTDELEAAQEALATAKEEIATAPAPKDEKAAANDVQIIEALKAQISALQALLEEKTKLLSQAMSPALQDAAIAERLSLIDLARSVIPEFKHDGLSNREIKLKVIEKALPFKSDVKIDTLENVRVDAQFDAAAQLAREKASLRTDSVSSPRIDEAEIEKKRSARLNMYQA